MMLRPVYTAKSSGLVSLGLLALIPSVAGDACQNDDVSMEDHITDTNGISLMQSGGSILPVLSKQGNDFALRDGLVDEFAAMEDEFDDGYMQIPPASTVQRISQGTLTTARSLSSAPMFNHVRNPYLYVETLLVIAICALTTRLFKWMFSSRPQKSQAVEPPPQATSTPCSRADRKGFAALEQAVRAGDEVMCAEVLQGDRWAVRGEDPCGCTALHIAAHCGSTAMARLLLKHGAKVNALEAWDETPLHFAARSGSVEVCSILLEHGADIDAKNACGWTPLRAAGHAEQESICEMLLTHGAGAGGVADTDLPPLLNAMIVGRIFTDRTEASAKIESEGADGEKFSHGSDE